jgi:hypothetical protein
VDLTLATEQFRDRGWTVAELPDGAVVLEVRDRLLGFLHANGVPGLTGLDQYHHLVDDGQHLDILDRLAAFYWQQRFGLEIVTRNLDPIRQLVGLDLHVQTFPYLRVVRPSRPADVVGLHRDTNYGASPYEVSIVVPFTNLDASGALRVVSRSHVAPRDAYPATRRPDLGVAQGSREHRLGFPYAPQVLSPSVRDRAEPVPLRVGQALFMSLSLVHGQEVNEAATTRVSTDIRVVNSLAPVSWSRGVRRDYYSPLCSSAVTEQANRYLAAGDAEGPPAVGGDVTPHHEPDG